MNDNDNLPNCRACNGAAHLFQRFDGTWQAQCKNRFTTCPVNMKTKSQTKQEAIDQWTLLHGDKGIVPSQVVNGAVVEPQRIEGA